MVISIMHRPEEISESEFARLLAQYPAVVRTVSDSKPAKPGQKSLQLLDQFRYVDAPDSFGRVEPQHEMTLDEVERLVEWKLSVGTHMPSRYPRPLMTRSRHGKFRPTLMSLVSSNAPSLVQSTIAEAIDAYRSSSSPSPSSPPSSGAIAKAITTLAKLRGIGPATASLLLSVHDPERVIFFSDEAFYWLCSDGSKASIKYNAHEYSALCDRAATLVRRLRVSAMDIERVAYVIMRQPVDDGKVVKEQKARTTLPKQQATSAKRKTMSTSAQATRAIDTPGVRRSKRLKS
ncbi:hypothetical protein DCS_06621 [Drechmeria coniospora]|uniref:Uncharacterized protein n=1 Tax=Drechmeria coniospora TaxID=98403 RepID=A0A151GC80_DRECN|nr:hypothetical protein DCS_06621 [Drechmeria coniospora]KYK54661.1 hypothetical protein DCS_06621 [Drechmeria coniospora]